MLELPFSYYLLFSISIKDEIKLNIRLPAASNQTSPGLVAGLSVVKTLLLVIMQLLALSVFTAAHCACCCKCTSNTALLV